MRVLVMGSGLLGVVTAYVLASRGHSVTVIERKSESAAETSFANGGQLSYSHAEPWANPHMLGKLPAWLFRADSPLIFRPRLDLDMIRWGIAFLRNCTAARAAENCANTLRLALYSREKMAVLMRETGIAFDYAEKGILHIFDHEESFRHARMQAAFQARFGCEETPLSRDEVLALEPALAATGRHLIGGMLATLDASGDARTFCIRLAEWCERKLGVTFHYRTAIDAVRRSGGRVDAVVAGGRTFTADAYVAALGSYTSLLKSIGLRLPIYPMKGYSITLPANDATPHISLTDGSYKIVFSRLGDRLRIAGTAEFAGHDARIMPKRIAPIIAAAKTLLPLAAWDAPREEWACLRPSTPRGTPTLGRTPYANLFLNTGHGTLGWTLAAGSAFAVADVIEGHAPEIDLSGLTLKGAAS
ncbi:MAG: D-amino acid dehydrogenase [Alphaproteobacteria bacterium]|nr:D-amino acid dehydrogenase [Alphaproteobacteria bacterium]